MLEEQKKAMGSILARSSAYWQSCTIHAAVRLEIFTHLDEKTMSAEAVAALLGSPLRGCQGLLGALTAMNLLEHRDGGYRNTESSRILLNRDSPHYIGHIIKHHHHLVDNWARLEEAVLTGAPVDGRSYGEEAERESFLLGMHNLASTNAPELAQKLDLAKAGRLLDLGGGPGTYSIYFCLAHPDLTAVIFDRPTTRPFAEKTIASFGLSGQISFAAGDFVHDPLPPGPFDAIWASQILHSYGPGDCLRLLRKCLAALSPGGTVYIHEFFLNDTMDGPLFPALFTLNMLLNNDEGRSYGATEITTMLAEAGFGGIHRVAGFEGPNNSSVMAGHRPV